ncbi:MAG: transcription elongation factor GreA [Patescibacteria group bacterium]
MNDHVTYLTKHGLEKLQTELEMLVHVRRREIASRIQEAKELGDLSENAEYQEAKNEQAFNEGRIEELESTLHNVMVIDEAAEGNGLIQVGSTVHVSNGQPRVLHIVGSNEADPLNGQISNESPLGQSLIGKQAGDQISVVTPRGPVTYRIAKVK